MKPNTIENTVCPFCGLACDDLTLTINELDIRTSKQLPDYCRNSYAAASLQQTPDCLIQGKPVDIDVALAHSVKLLRTADQPLFGGLTVDVNGARAALALAKRCGATLDHKNSNFGLHNAQVTQDEGWTNCTLSEARNRAEMIVVLGTKPLISFPRLVERLAPSERGNFQDKPPQWVLIGPWHREEKVLKDIMNGQNYQILPLEHDQLADFPRTLNKMLRDEPTNSKNDTAEAADEWQKWFYELLACRFSVFTWSAADFPRFALQSLAQFLKQMNCETRCMGLPMAGSQADLTFQQVCTWQTGSPGRISFMNGNAKHDPDAYSSQTMLEQHKADVLLWISPLDTTPMPASEIPTILIGHPAAEDKTKAEVFIPAGIPGVDHAGHLCRTDMVVTLHLKKIRDSQLRSSAELLTAMLKQLSD